MDSFSNLAVAGEVVEVEVEVVESLCHDLWLYPLIHILPVSDSCTSLLAPNHQYSPDLGGGGGEEISFKWMFYYVRSKLVSNYFVVQLKYKSMLKMQRSILVEIHPEAQLLHGPPELPYLKLSQDYISPVLYFRPILFKKHNQIPNQEKRNEKEIKGELLPIHKWNPNSYRGHGDTQEYKLCPVSRIIKPIKLYSILFTWHAGIFSVPILYLKSKGNQRH